MKKPYQILEHTTDLKIRARGKTKAELFSNMLQGMFESIKPEFKNQEQIKRKLNIKSTNKETLLIDFLNDALYLSDVHNEAYTEAHFSTLNDTELVGQISGYSIKKFALEIKAVTYHNIKIIKDREGYWSSTVLFDI